MDVWWIVVVRQGEFETNCFYNVGLYSLPKHVYCVEYFKYLARLTYIEVFFSIGPLAYWTNSKGKPENFNGIFLISPFILIILDHEEIPNGSGTGPK